MSDGVKMTASKQPSSNDLESLDAVYRAAFAKLAARNPEHALSLCENLRLKVKQLAEFGVVDRETLRDLAIDLMPSPKVKVRRRGAARRD